MKRYILNGFTAIALLFAVACKPTIDSPVGKNKGTADFTKYIAVGNSLTSGFADGGLYLEGQKVAYPNLIAAQMIAVGGGNFSSPFFNDAQSNGSGYLKLTGFNNGSPVLENEDKNLAYTDATLKYLTKYTSEIQNLGIPGMRLDLSFDPTGAFSAQNMYFERLLPNEQVGKINYFTFLQGRNHTFFSLWLGNNDALGFATNGGVTTNATQVLTAKATFTALYSNMVNALTANGQKGIVATIPDVTAVPYFNTVTVEALLTAAKAINPQAQAVFIQTTAGVRAATATDLIRLPFQSSGLFGKPNAGGLPYGLHPSNPITSDWVLDAEEVATVKDYVNSYNASIKSIAESKGLAVADTYTYFNRVKTGIAVNGVNVNAAFITGNAFSLDGIHLTPKGNALIANFFIDAINAKYGSTLSHTDPSQYRGVKFPD
jgi:hypothetical protein